MIWKITCRIYENIFIFDEHTYEIKYVLIKLERPCIILVSTTTVLTNNSIIQVVYYLYTITIPSSFKFHINSILGLHNEFYTICTRKRHGILDYMRNARKIYFTRKWTYDRKVITLFLVALILEFILLEQGGFDWGK